MSLLPTIGAVDQDTGFYKGVITTSMRFDDADTVNLNLTSSQAPTSTALATFSCWVKRGHLGSACSIFGTNGSGTSGDNASWIAFTSDNFLDFANVTGGSYTGRQRTTMVFRDTTSWYHIVVRIDLANSTASNRVRIYVNGSLAESAFVRDSGAPAAWASDGAMQLTTAVASARIGAIGYATANPYDGYLADVNLVDGASLAPASFGEDKNGVWIPIAPAVSEYGNCGFRLQFLLKGTAQDADGMGADTSGKARHFAKSSGNVASDSAMPDSPENNFATLMGTIAEASDYQSYARGTYTEGNLKVTGVSAGWTNGKSNQLVNSGKWYAEFVVNAWFNSVYVRLGVYARPARTYDEYFRLGNGDSQIDATRVDARTGAFSLGDVVQIAIDLENNNIFFGTNNTWENSATESEIEAGTATNAFASGSEVPTGDGYYYGFYANPHSASTNITCNFGQDPTFNGVKDSSTSALTPSNSGAGSADSEGNGKFFYAPPDGFLALCTANISDDNIAISPAQTTQADNYFGTLTWSGDSNATRKIATGESGVTGTVDFTPDWSWIKTRNGGANGNDHLLLDIVRGVDAFNGLSANVAQVEGLTAAGSTWFNFGDINNFETGGFTVQKGPDGSHTLEGINLSSHTYVAWNWKAGGEPTADNSAGVGATPTAGSVKIDGVNLGSALAGTTAATRLTANTTAGFSIIKYAGNSASKTVAHGLNSAPTFVIAKSLTDAERWVVFHNSISTKYIYLNETFAGATGNADERFGDSTNVVVPNDTVVTMGANNSDINENGDNYIMYAFHDVEGYSRFGKYGGLGSGGEFVYLGFRPAFVIFKVDAASTQWLIFDSTRATSNLIDDVVLSTTIQAEGFSSGMELDFLSNGFKIQGSNNDISYSGQTHIYMAFAESPFKYANAR